MSKSLSLGGLLLLAFMAGGWLEMLGRAPAGAQPNDRPAPAGPPDAVATAKLSDTKKMLALSVRGLPGGLLCARRHLEGQRRFLG